MTDTKQVGKYTINLPDTGLSETTHTIIGNRIVFVTIEHDQDCQNPLEDCDGMGHIWSLSNRHINHHDIEEVREVLENNQDAVKLSYYEHGLCRWDVAGSRSYPDAQWDSVSFAGIWIPDDSLIECVGPKYDNLAPGSEERAKRMREYAQQACGVYTDWANGNCYGYIIKVYELRTEDGDPYTEVDDYRKKKPLYDDSCWGYIGDDIYRGIEEGLPDEEVFA